MKHLLLSLLLSCIFLVPGNAGISEWFPVEGPKITISIEIGIRPNCILAWAICHIEMEGLGLNATIQTFPVEDGSGGGGGGSWLLTMPRQNLARYHPEFLVKLDGKSTVTFEDTYVVPSDVKNALGSAGDLVIKGNTPYPLKHKNGEYVITLPL